LLRNSHGLSWPQLGEQTMNAHVRPPGAADPLPDSPDPLDIAVDAERHDPAPDSPARRLLIDQGRLIRTQIASERMGVVLKVADGRRGRGGRRRLGVMAWDASRTEALVSSRSRSRPSWPNGG
jgi:hypothetical protein